MTAHPHDLRPQARKLTSLSDQVYDHLRFAIISSSIQPGEKLVELEIAAQMGTSQGPIREALQRLERDGLVERRARSATYVTTITIDGMYELFSIRRMIESFAIQRTAQKITAQQCDYLDELIQKMAASGSQQEINTLADYDMQLHRHIVEWSGSPSLLYAWMPLSSQIQRFIVQSHPQQYPDFVEVGTRHQPIVEALRRHDSDGAAQAVQDHIMLIWSSQDFAPDQLRK
jgi:DNA-binding GntR family transcriptional regulator